MKQGLESVNGKAWVYALVLLALLGMPSLLAADPLRSVKNVQLGYAIYLGGLHVMDSATAFNHEGRAYTIQLKAGTQGFIRSLAPWDADVTSSGRLEDDRVAPQHSRIVTRWREEPKEVAFDFKKGERVQARFNPPQGSDDHEKIPDDLLFGALDPLSGVLQVMASFAYGKGCQQIVPIFDGHRRFDLVLTPAGTENLGESDYSLYAGPADKCRADLTMRAGSRKDREGSRFWEDAKGKSHRPAVHIYLAKVRDDLPPVPVLAETSTPLGGIAIHLTRIGGETQKSAGL